MNGADVKVLFAACWPCLEDRERSGHVERGMDDYLEDLRQHVTRPRREKPLRMGRPDRLL